MVIPKLFRWLFFKKSKIKTVFDAVRNPSAIYINVNLELEKTSNHLNNHIYLNQSSFAEFVQETLKDEVLILYGNHKNRRTEFYNKLVKEGFENVYDLGTNQDLQDVKSSI